MLARDVFERTRVDDQPTELERGEVAPGREDPRIGDNLPVYPQTGDAAVRIDRQPYVGAAAALGLRPTTLYGKMRKFGISKQSSST